MHAGKFLWLFLLFLMGSSLAGCGGTSAGTATEVKTGTISGKVTNKGGAAVEGALVELTAISSSECAAANDKSIIDPDDEQTQAEIELLKQCHTQFGERMSTDAKGYYKFLNVPAGQYTIWIHWNQYPVPDVPLDPIPSTGFFYRVLSVQKVGSARVDVSVHEETVGLYEIDVSIPTFTFSAEEDLKVNFKW
jgi:hypothetical protein